MENSNYYYQEQYNKMRLNGTTLLKLLSVCCILVCICFLPNDNEFFKIFYSLAVIMLFTTITSKKTVAIKLTESGFDLICNKKTISHTYSDLIDLRCYHTGQKLLWIIPVPGDWVIDFCFEANERYLFYKSYTVAFDELWGRLVQKYNLYLSQKYKCMDISTTEFDFRQKLRIKDGKLQFSSTYVVPLHSLTSRTNQENGKIEIVYHYDNGSERVWITLEPKHFSNTFTLNYIISRYGKDIAQPIDCQQKIAATRRKQ